MTLHRIAFSLLSLVVALATQARAEKPLVDYVDCFLGTAPITDVDDIGFTPPWRVWAGLTFPGASVPNAMVQLSPITEWRTGAGYEYEDEQILAFTHTNKGHWNLCYVPLLPVTGDIDYRDFGSKFLHANEAASPGYYRVLLERYGIDCELTSTLRCGYHKYAFPAGETKKVVVNLPISNERVREWEFVQDGDFAFQGFQQAGEKVYFYAVTNQKIEKVEQAGRSWRPLKVIEFAAGEAPLEIKIGLSFVSIEGAKANLQAELAGKTFEQVRSEASATWESLLGKIKVNGGTDRERGLFYSCLYRSFLWPALRSDTDGAFTNQRGEVVRRDFAYYTDPSLWDDYRNKLVLLGSLSPQVTCDVISSMIDRGEIMGHMPTFFHGDHAAPFIAGSYLRGLRDFDAKKAYELLVKNATVENRSRPHILEYIEKGYVATPRVERPNVETKAKAGVTKTLEYAYDDYAVALLAKEMGDDETYERMMTRSKNYANQFDKQTGLMRGRYDHGGWVTPFDAEYPYYEYLYREANAWQSSFFAPHDTQGLIALYDSPAAFEQQLDTLFTKPWNPQHIAMNINSFIGQYCHGNQPDHGYPWLYYWVDKQPKSQAILNEIMQRFYGMQSGHTLCGMDDAGEMSAWYVYTAIGLYPYSPADDKYIVSVPLFDTVELQLGDRTVLINRQGKGTKIKQITSGKHDLINGSKRDLDGYFISHAELIDGQVLSIHVEDRK